MAKDSRALTLKLLADINDFTKNINKADNEVVGFGDKVKKFGKIAGAAFAAAGVAAALYAGKLLKDGVKAAIADEKANALLAKTLQNVAGATEKTIEKTLAYTRATELATGVTEDELRPSLNRLVIATGSVQKAMQLQTLALDVSAGSGKSLEAVTQALAKAQEGNTASLVRLGIGLSAAQLKTMSMDDVTKSLAETFAGAADTAANTFEGKMTRLGLAFEDVRDTVGGFVLDAITPMVENFVTKVMPALAAFADGLTGGSGLKNAFDQIIDVAKTIFIPVLQGIQFVFNKVKDAVMDNEEAFKALWSFTKNILAPFMGGAFKVAFQVIGTVIGTTVSAVGKLISAFQTLFEWGSKVAGFLGFGGSSKSATTSMAGPTPPSNSKMALPPILPNSKGLIAGGSNVTNNITVNGAIDSESAARQIVQVLNQSSYRGTLGAGALVAV
jgi:phage-related protein